MAPVPRAIFERVFIATSWGGGLAGRGVCGRGVCRCVTPGFGGETAPLVGLDQGIVVTLWCAVGRNSNITWAKSPAADHRKIAECRRAVWLIVIVLARRTFTRETSGASALTLGRR